MSYSLFKDYEDKPVESRRRKCYIKNISCVPVTLYY